MLLRRNIPKLDITVYTTTKQPVTVCETKSGHFPLVGALYLVRTFLLGDIVHDDACDRLADDGWMECANDSPPSQLPLATILTVPGFLQSTSTASMWPSRLAMNGFANILSILAAFTARMRSRARAKGWSRGSRLREVGVGSPGLAGRCADGACCRTEIFWAGGEHGLAIGRRTDLPSRRLWEFSNLQLHFFRRVLSSQFHFLNSTQHIPEQAPLAPP